MRLRRKPWVDDAFAKLDGEFVFTQDLDKFKEKNPNKCVMRCNNPTYSKNLTISKLLGKLKFSCKNGCKQEIYYSDLENHYKTTCPVLEKHSVNVSAIILLATSE